MIPVLVDFGFFQVRSYGLMLSVAFLVAWWVLRKGMRRRGWADTVAYDFVAIAAVFGVLGSKLFFVIDHWEEVRGDVLGTVFSGTGLTFLGGPVLAAPAVLLYLRWRGCAPLKGLDAAAPALAVGAAVGRIGCLLAGDGCYGVPTDLPWGMTFPNGVVRTFVPVHPTPLYETLWYAALTVGLVAYDARRGGRGRPGGVFAAFLVAYGLGRFLVEFIRTNPRYALGLSQAQFISLAAMAGGVAWLVGLAVTRRREEGDGADRGEESARAGAAG